MPDQMYPVTKQGHEQLKIELKHLMSVVRPEVVQSIADAREHGDLKENAEYHAAKERQGFVEGRIQELNGKLAQCNVIDISRLSGEKVIFGATVTYVDIETDAKKTYQIVGEDEANIKEYKISYLSPLAKLLLGCRVNDEVVWNKPSGNEKLTITDIYYCGQTNPNHF